MWRELKNSTKPWLKAGPPSVMTVSGLSKVVMYLWSVSIVDAIDLSLVILEKIKPEILSLMTSMSLFNIDM